MNLLLAEFSLTLEDILFLVLNILLLESKSTSLGGIPMNFSIHTGRGCQKVRFSSGIWILLAELSISRLRGIEKFCSWAEFVLILIFKSPFQEQHDTSDWL